MNDWHGRFLWYELATTDMAGAKSFYSKVMGWSTRDGAMGEGAYTLFTVGEASAGGLMTWSVDAQREGARPQWIGYIGVRDVHAAADQVRQLGGAIALPPTDIPGLSRFCIIRDPQQATVALFKWMKPDQEPAALTAAGHVGWHELLTTDRDQAFAFYHAIFGWQKGIVLPDTEHPFQMFSTSGQTIGGILNKPPTIPLPCWLLYFNVRDIDAAGQRVKAGGGQVFAGPTEVANGSWVLQCADPQGAVFALTARRRLGKVSFLERMAAQHR